MAKAGRNDPCHCGSGKKYKKCCQPKEQAAEHAELVKEQLRREEARRAAQHRAQEEFLASLVEVFVELIDRLEPPTTQTT